MNKINFHNLMEEEIKKNVDKNLTPTLFLHSCCGPCTTYPLDLLSKYFKLTIYYYNPNIDKYDEYIKRAKQLEKLLDQMKTENEVKLIIDEYDHQEFLKVAEKLKDEPERGKRCSICYFERMEKAAKYAKEQGFDYFTTTLSVCPLKDYLRINKIGIYLEKKYDIKYLRADFKKKDGYKKSIEFSKKYNLYRQNYCGCEFCKKGGYDEN